MKKIISVVILLGILFCGYQILINVVFSEKTTTYSVKGSNDLDVKITQKKKNNNYSFDITLNNITYRINHISKQDGQLITDIYYIKESKVECIYPVIKDLSNDVICFIDGNQINYLDIKNKDKKIISFVRKLMDAGYTYPEWGTSK